MKECKKGLCEGAMNQQCQAIYGKGKGKGRYSQRTSLKTFFNAIASSPTSSSSKTLGQISSERQDQARQDRLAKKAAKGQGHTPSAQATLSPPPFFAGHRQKHSLTTRLVPAKYTDEKYTLFRRYQMAIHKEGPNDVSKQGGFSRFLCENPFEDDDDDDDLAARDGKHSFGSYHMEWYLDDQQLIAVGVLDLLPHCLSSVYLFYDPDYEHLQLGKISALREILLVEELRREKGLEQLRWYYLGYYIHNCQKMRYKAGYKPSEILDVVSRRVR